MGALDACAIARTGYDAGFDEAWGLLEEAIEMLKAMPEEDRPPTEVHGVSPGDQLMGIEPHFHDPWQEMINELEAGKETIRELNTLFYKAIEML